MQNRLSSKPYKRYLIGGVFWLFVWQMLHIAIDSSLLLPSPAEVFLVILGFIPNPDFYIIVASSFFRISLGVLIGAVIGVLSGIGIYYSPLLEAVLRIPLSAIKSTPVASFVILALVWIKSSNLSVFIAFLMVTPIFAENVSTGLNSISEEIKEMVRVYKVPIKTQIAKVYYPFLSPFLKNAMRLSIGLGWKAGIAAEVLAVPNNSIGTMLYNSKVYLEMTELFAWTIVIILISMLPDILFSRGANKFENKSQT